MMKRNEQLRDTLVGIAAWCATPQGEPTGHPGHQEEKRHPPGREEYAKKSRQGASFRVLDAPWNQFIKWHEGVEKNNAQDGNYLQPVEIVQPGGFFGCFFHFTWLPAGGDDYSPRQYQEITQGER